MKLLAIDPGPDYIAYVCWDTEAHDFVKDMVSDSILGITFYVRKTIEDIFKHIDVGVVAVECPQNYGIAMGKSTLETLMMVGRIQEIVSRLSSDFVLYGRPTIKGQIGGRTDSEIRCSLRMRYGEAKKGEKLEGVRRDIWAALALAVALEEKPNLKEW